MTVLDSSNNVATYSDDKVSAVFSSFAVVAQVRAKCHKNAVQQLIDFMRAHCYNHTQRNNSLPCTTQDCNGRTVRRGDTVKLTSGPAVGTHVKVKFHVLILEHLATQP